MTHGKPACGLLQRRVGVPGMSGKSDGIWADLRKQRKIKYRDRDIMDHQHADFRGNSGVRFVCRLKGGAPKGAPPSHKRPQCGRFPHPPRCTGLEFWSPARWSKHMKYSVCSRLLGCFWVHPLGGSARYAPCFL